MLNYVTFDVDIERNVDGSRLAWPEPGAAMHDSGLGLNREYCDLRRLYWRDAKEVYEAEGALISRIEAAHDPAEEYELIEEEACEEPDGLSGLDIGVASTVIALSAARCIPFSSCNGGAYGGRHHERHPLVAFYSRVEALDLLLACSRSADVGLVTTAEGCRVVFARDVRNMRVFAKALFDSRGKFRMVRSPPRRGGHPKSTGLAKQLKLL